MAVASVSRPSGRQEPAVAAMEPRFVSSRTSEPSRRAREIGWFTTTDRSDSSSVSIPCDVRPAFLSVRGTAGVHDIDRFLIAAGIEIIAVTAEHARIARDGFLRYGKGRHAAALNYGDCFSYALAKATGQPLLCKGDDFARTDIDLVAVAEWER